MAPRALLSFTIFVSLCLLNTEVALAARHLLQSTPTTGGGSAIPGLPNLPFSFPFSFPNIPTIPTLPSSLPSITPMPSIPNIPSIPPVPKITSMPTIPKMPSIPQIPGVPQFQIPPMPFSAPPPSPPPAAEYSHNRRRLGHPWPAIFLPVPHHPHIAVIPTLHSSNTFNSHHPHNSISPQDPFGSNHPHDAFNSPNSWRSTVPDSSNAFLSATTFIGVLDLRSRVGAFWELINPNPAGDACAHFEIPICRNGMFMDTHLALMADSVHNQGRKVNHQPQLGQPPWTKKKVSTVSDFGSLHW
ncbi:IgA FC receptor [Nymphaea thermarum]|nr:IgA FC receptor [Nymphaea thermarum]